MLCAVAVWFSDSTDVEDKGPTTQKSTTMKTPNLEPVITKTGIYSLAALAIIGIVASFICMCEIDVNIFSGTFIESIFIFILLVLSINVSFCFPASFLINFSRIAANLKARKESVEE